MLTDDTKEFCEKLINKSEILKSITNLSCGKMPDSGGLLQTFYKFF